MPGRNWTAGSAGGYGFGFNGKMKDDGIKGISNSYDFGARIYDARIGKWLCPDPKQFKYPYLSPFHFGDNSPTQNIDPTGYEHIKSPLLEETNSMLENQEDKVMSDENNHSKLLNHINKPKNNNKLWSNKPTATSNSNFNIKQNNDPSSEELWIRFGQSFLETYYEDLQSFLLSYENYEGNIDDFVTAFNNFSENYDFESSLRDVGIDGKDAGQYEIRLKEMVTSAVSSEPLENGRYYTKDYSNDNINGGLIRSWGADGTVINPGYGDRPGVNIIRSNIVFKNFVLKTTIYLTFEIRENS